MAKRWFGYVDQSRRSNSYIQSAGVAEFDTKKMTKEDRETLKEWEAPGGEDVAEEILDSVYPTKIYFSIDNLNASNIREKFSTKPLEGSSEWPVDCQNVFTNLESAWYQIYKNKSLIFKEIFEATT